VDWNIVGTTFVTLTVIIDPVGVAPVFIATTAPLSRAQHKDAALRAVLAAGALIIGFALFGGAVLDYLDVSVDSLSIAGGLLLMLVALEMLRGMDYPDATDSGQDAALVPIATPLLAGPGAIATVIVLSRSHGDFAGKASVLIGILVRAGRRRSRDARRRARQPDPAGIAHQLPHARLRTAAQRDRRPARRERGARDDQLASSGTRICC
jgi:MarC family membrane protein